MAMMRKAQRRKAKLRLGISGPAGSGKTFSSLLMGYGITHDWDKICLIDTENFSGDLYADYNKDGIEIGEYNIIPLTPPYTPDKYIAAIKECEQYGIECIIIDSLTHAWAGEGGLLDKKGQLEKKTGNGWTAWRDITPQHNRLVETILSSSCHIIGTLRAKMEYVQEKNEQGKTVIRKVGMNPIQRDGMEYEFTVFIDIDQDHNATTSKDRTSLLDGLQFKPGFDTGRQLLAWLEKGVDAPTPPVVEPPKIQPAGQGQEKASQTQITKIYTLATKGNLTREQVHAHIQKTYNVNSTKDLTTAQANAFIETLDKAIKKAQTTVQQTAVTTESNTTEQN